MQDLTIGELILVTAWNVGLGAMILGVVAVARKWLTKTSFLRFLAVLLVNSAAALVPFGIFGLMMGAPALLISAVAVTYLTERNRRAD